MATKTQNPPSQDPQPDNPNKTLTLESPHPPQPDLPADSHSASSISQQLATDGAGAENPTKDGEDSTAKGTEGDAAVVEAATGRGSPVNDIQKKFRRAERFGVPVQLSEKEKRNSRAERFGIASGSGAGSDGSKAAEEQKRKARAERFGLPVAEDEEAKKKARLARFAPQTKTDSVEEEKRKARAIRFSQTPSSSLSDVNGKGNVDTMTAISDKETGGA